MVNLWKASAALAALSLATLAVFAAPREERALCGGRSYPLGAVANGAAPYVRLSADGVAGAFLIDYGATRSSLSAAAFAAPEGAARNADVSLAGVGKAAFSLRAYDMPLAPSGGQLGVIGTDLLSRLSVQFSGRAVFVGAAPCRPDELRARGLVPISQRGFFAADPTLNDDHHPNVPVVFVSVGGVHAWAQLDTGYDDVVYAHSVDITQPLFDRLVESGVALERVADIGVATCEGAESRGVYRVADRPLAIETGQGAPIARIRRFYLILKRANGCGGIADMTTPAAQLGASFLKVFRTVLFDPGDETVWLEGPGGVSRETAF
jgi:hypothetical protein